MRRRRVGSGDGEAPVVPRTPTISLESFDLYTKVRDEESVHSASGATGTQQNSHARTSFTAREPVWFDWICTSEQWNADLLLPIYVDD